MPSIAAEANAAVTIPLDDRVSCVAVDIRGTLGGGAAHSFEATLDGTNWYAVPAMIPTAVAPVVSVLSTTGTGVFLALVPGAAQFRLRRSTAGTGVATVTLKPSNAGINFGVAVALA